MAGLLYVVVAGLIYRIGTVWIDRLLPPVVVGSVVIVIGLGLARTAVEMAGLLPPLGDGALSKFTGRMDGLVYFGHGYYC